MKARAYFSICFRILFFVAFRWPGCRLHAAPGHDSDNALLIRCFEEVGRHSTHTTTTQLSIFAQTKLKAAFVQIAELAGGMACRRLAAPKRKSASVAWEHVHIASSPSLPQKTSRGLLGLVGAGHAAAVKREMRPPLTPYRPVETVVSTKGGILRNRSKLLQGRSASQRGHSWWLSSSPPECSSFFLGDAACHFTVWTLDLPRQRRSPARHQWPGSVGPQLLVFRTMSQMHLLLGRVW